MFTRFGKCFKRTHLVAITVAFLFLVMPTSVSHAASAPYTATCTTNGLCVRTGPGTNYGKIGSLNSGAAISVLEEKDGWYRFDYNGKTGWSSGKYLSVSDTDADGLTSSSADASIGSAVCSASTLKVRSGPGSSYKQIGSIQKNKAVTLYDEENGWYQIAYGSKKGWVSAQYLTNLKLSNTGNNTNTNTDGSNTIIGYAVINVSSGSLNVRKGPGTSFARLGTVKDNARLAVYTDQSGWLMIHLGDQEGWICKTYAMYSSGSDPVQSPATNPTPSPSSTATPSPGPTDTSAPASSDEGDGNAVDDSAPIGTGIVNTVSSSLTVRKGPGTSNAKIGSLAKGEAVDIMSISGSWYYISFNGSFGYVSKTYIKIVDIDETQAPATPPVNQDPMVTQIKGTVKLINWFGSGGARDIWPAGSNFTMIDVRTGTVLHMKYWCGTNHADIEPLTKDDTAALKKCYGGRWSWSRRPVWVIINGQAYAGSINGMPHGGETIKNNGMDGQICLHFVGSKTHNNNKVCPLHQAAVQEAYLAGK